MAREGSETAAQGEGSLWQDKPAESVLAFSLCPLVIRPQLRRTGRSGYLQAYLAINCLHVVPRFRSPRAPCGALPGLPRMCLDH